MRTRHYHASEKIVGILLDRSHDTVKIAVLGVEIRIGRVIESKMADDELVAMDLSWFYFISTDILTVFDVINSLHSILATLYGKIHDVNRNPVSGSAAPRPILVFFSHHAFFRIRSLTYLCQFLLALTGQMDRCIWVFHRSEEYFACRNTLFHTISFGLPSVIRSVSGQAGLCYWRRLRYYYQYQDTL